MDRIVRKRTEITVETETRTTISWRSVTLRPLTPDIVVDVEPVVIPATDDLDGRLVTNPDRIETEGERK